MKAVVLSAIIVISLSLALTPAATAHLGADVNPRSCSTSVRCDSPSALLPADTDCLRYYSVGAQVTHIHNTFYFPTGFVGDLAINIQEAIPIAGDYVTFYHRQCSATIPYNDVLSPICGGQQVRDGHAGTTHRWSGSGGAKVCEPLFCNWWVATSWS